MQVLRELSELRNLPGPVFLAIGVFDGVHRGHQALVAESLADALRCHGTAVVMTFEPHPVAFFHPSNTPLRLSASQHKKSLLKKLGISHLLTLDFNRSRAEQTADDFVNELMQSCNPLGGICVGAKWRFGRGRQGDITLLQKLGNRYGFEVDGIPPVCLNGSVISSSLIRMAVEAGDLHLASSALGRPYSVMGRVVEGRQAGRLIGFPTANIKTDGLQLPPNGVYAARTIFDNQRFLSVVNLGVRPTLTDASLRVMEAHLLGFSGNLYERDVEVEFLRFLRKEQKFASLEELRAQIQCDVEQARLLA